MAITDDILERAAPMPLPDAAFELWRTRNFFIRETEQAAPEKLNDPARAAAYGQQFAAALASDRCAAPDSGVLARLRRTHSRATEAERADALRAAVAFDDDCIKFYPHERGDDWDKACRAVAEASRHHPGYSEETLEAARMHIATSMR
jgi:hypothetical protein